MLSGLILNQNSDLAEVYVIEQNITVFLFIPNIIKQFISIGNRYHLFAYDHKYAFALRKE